MMVLLQLGFLGAVRITATNVYDQLDFDVVLISREYEQFYDPGAFPLARLREAESVDAVVAARPLYALFALALPPVPARPSPHRRPERRPRQTSLGVARAGGWETGGPARSSAASCW